MTDKISVAEPKMGWFKTLASILASIAGVRSQRHFEEDFAHGSWQRYLVTLAVVLLAFLLLHMAMVKVLLYYYGYDG